MKNVLVIEGRPGVEAAVRDRLARSAAIASCRSGVGPPGDEAERLAAVFAADRTDVVVYGPSYRDARGALPDTDRARKVLGACARAGTDVILLSSAAVYGANHHNPGLLSEGRPSVRHRRNRVASAWIALEEAAELATEGRRLAILRAAPTPTPDGPDYFSRWLGRRANPVLPGHDPPLQFLSPDDLAEAVACIVSEGGRGVYHVAPDDIVPVRAALRLAGSRGAPVPYVLQLAARAVLARRGFAAPPDQTEYVRYSWTVSNRRARHELGFRPRMSSAEVAQSLRPASSRGAAPPAHFDAFGMDRAYIESQGRRLFRFLERRYWRIEVRGLEQVPAEGPAVIVGPHRGFMPWDGVMIVHLLTRDLGRVPRFLIHPGLIKFPFLADFMARLGGMVICRQNADRVLSSGEILGIFPEGIRGAFSLYRDANHVGRFGHDDYVKFALRNRAPIVPFVTVGCAETFPILGKLKWKWWERHTEWPFFPLTVPLPLPSKWGIQFLAPLHVERSYGPERADDRALVRAIGDEVRDRIASALEAMLTRRPSPFYGSAFEPQGC